MKEGRGVFRGGVFKNLKRKSTVNYHSNIKRDEEDDGKSNIFCAMHL